MKEINKIDLESWNQVAKTDWYLQFLILLYEIGVVKVPIKQFAEWYDVKYDKKYEKTL